MTTRRAIAPSFAPIAAAATVGAVADALSCVADLSEVPCVGRALEPAEAERKLQEQTLGGVAEPVAGSAQETEAVTLLLMEQVQQAWSE